LLIEDQNLEQFVAGINEMIADENMWQLCKNNAKKSVEKFEMSNIGAHWLNYLKQH